MKDRLSPEPSLKLSNCDSEKDKEISKLKQIIEVLGAKLGELNVKVGEVLEEQIESSPDTYLKDLQVAKKELEVAYA